MDAAAKRHQVVNVRAHPLCYADYDFEFASDSGNVTGFLQQLNIATGIGECTGLFISRGGWQHDFRPRRIGAGWQEALLRDLLLIVGQGFTNRFKTGNQIDGKIISGA